MKNPIQPLIKDKQGVIRFKKNEIVRRLLDEGNIDLNQIAHWDVSQDDQEQFAQLIGYSHSGFGELSYVSDDTYDTAELMILKQNEQTAKNIMLTEKLKLTRKFVKELTTLLFRIHPDDLKL